MSQAGADQSAVGSERSVQHHRAAAGLTNGAPAFRSLFSTAELSERPSRPPDYAAENGALIALAREMAASPDGILQKLAETALTLCGAHSAGLSLLEDGDQRKRFHWRALAGQWSPHLNGGTPREFGPCGTVLDRNVALLCSHPELDFPYFGEVRPLLEDGLLIPFHIKGEAVGTIWIVSHDRERRFDAEDLRVMTNLGAFAAAAYQNQLSLNATRRAELELRDFVDNASVGLHWVGPDGSIIWANRVEMEMLGVTPAEYLGHHISEFYVDQHVIEDVLRRLGNRETLHNQEARLRCKDGSIRHVLINSNVLWEGDKFIHTRCFTRDVTDRKHGEIQIGMLAREAEHRTKNVLATVQATVHLSHADSAEGLKQAIEGRIQALANVHTMFVQSRWTGAELHSLVTQELSPYRRDGESRAKIEGPPLMLEPNAAQTVGVTLHELATNAVKYGALSTPNGRVHVAWSHGPDGRLMLRWSESGGPPVKPPTRQGFGTRVMDGMLRQLKGEMRFDWRVDGLVCEIALPISGSALPDSESAPPGPAADHLPQPKR